MIPDCMSHWTLTHLTNLGVAAEVLLTGAVSAGCADSEVQRIVLVDAPAVLGWARCQAQDRSTPFIKFTASLCTS